MIDKTVKNNSAINEIVLKPDRSAKNLIVTALSLIAAIISLLFVTVLAKDMALEAQIYILSISLVIVILSTLVFSFQHLSVYSDKKGMENLIKKNHTLQHEFEDVKRNNIEHRVSINLKRLEEYYEININQARKNHKISVAALITGSLLIISAIIIYLFLKKSDSFAVILPSIGGLFIQILSGGYFVLYKQNISQTNAFYKQLINNQNTMLSISLMEKIGDENEKIEVSKMIINKILNPTNGNIFNENVKRKEQNSNEVLG